jgi:hypothetical protein
MRERMSALVAAYFASDSGPLRSLKDRHGVTHLVVDRRLFAAPPPYFAPFDAEARGMFAVGKPKGFELLRIVERGGAIETGGLFLVDLGRI